jgi:hypothetical protein
MSFTESETSCVLVMSRSPLAPGNAASSPLADASFAQPLCKGISVLEALTRHFPEIHNQMRGSRGGIHSQQEPVPCVTRSYKNRRSSVCHQRNTPGDNMVIPERADPCAYECHIAGGLVGGIDSTETRERYTRRHGLLPKRRGDIRHDQTEVLSPNAAVYVQGGRTIKDGVPAGEYRMDNQLLVQSSSCRLQWIRAFGFLFLHQLIVMWLPAART